MKRRAKQGSPQSGFSPINLLCSLESNAPLWFLSAPRLPVAPNIQIATRHVQQIALICHFSLHSPFECQSNVKYAPMWHSLEGMLTVAFKSFNGIHAMKCNHLFKAQEATIKLSYCDAILGLYQYVFDADCFTIFLVIHKFLQSTWQCPSSSTWANVFSAITLVKTVLVCPPRKSTSYCCMSSKGLLCVTPIDVPSLFFKHFVTFPRFTPSSAPCDSCDSIFKYESKVSVQYIHPALGSQHCNVHQEHCLLNRLAMAQWCPRILGSKSPQG